MQGLPHLVLVNTANGGNFMFVTVLGEKSVGGNATPDLIILIGGEEGYDIDFSWRGILRKPS